MTVANGNSDTMTKADLQDAIDQPKKFCLTSMSRKATGRLSAAGGDALAVLEGNMGEDDRIE